MQQPILSILCPPCELKNLNVYLYSLFSIIIYILRLFHVVPTNASLMNKWKVGCWLSDAVNLIPSTRFFFWSISSFYICFSHVVPTYHPPPPEYVKRRTLAQWRSEWFCMSNLLIFAILFTSLPLLLSWVFFGLLESGCCTLSFFLFNHALNGHSIAACPPPLFP